MACDTVWVAMVEAIEEAVSSDVEERESNFKMVNLYLNALLK